MEWNLLEEESRSDLNTAVKALKDHLELGSRVLVAQDFRHTVQDEPEVVGDYIRRLERTFRITYGNDKLSQETSEAFLYGQMQEGLKMTLLRSPNVSDAQNYHELCISAKNEERRLLELKKRSLYSASTTIPRAKVLPDDPREKPKSYQRPVNSWNQKVNIKKML